MRRCLMGILVLVACGDDGGAATATTDDSTTSTSGSGSSSTTTTTEGSTGEGSTGTTGVVDAECGDGVAEGPEPCDDGNPIEGDACSSDCMTAGPGRWLATYETAGLVSQAMDVAIDGAGNVFAVGSVIREGTGEDIWIHRYGPDGVLAWSVVSDAEGGEDLPLGIAGLTDDELTVASLTNTAFFRLDRITPDGNGIANFSDPTMTARSVVRGPNGNIVATGSAINSAAAVVTRAYDQEGVAQWTTEFAGETEGTQHGTALDIDADGNVYVGAMVGVIQAGLQTWVGKYSSAGAEVWVHDYTHEDALPGLVSSVAVGPGGHLWVVVETSDGSTQVDDVLFRYDPAGIKVWQAPLDNHMLDVAVGEDGSAVVVGALSGEGFGLSSAAFRSRKIDADGAELWTREMSAEFFIAGRAVALGPDGGYAVALDGIDDFDNPALAMVAAFDP